MKKTVQRRESDVNDNIMNQFSARKVVSYGRDNDVYCLLGHDAV